MQASALLPGLTISETSWVRSESLYLIVIDIFFFYELSNHFWNTYKSLASTMSCDDQFHSWIACYDELYFAPCHGLCGFDTQNEGGRSSLYSLCHSQLYICINQFSLWDQRAWMRIQQTVPHAGIIWFLDHKISHILDRMFPVLLYSSWDNRTNYKMFKMSVHHRFIQQSIHLVLNSSRKKSMSRGCCWERMMLIASKLHNGAWWL